MHLVDQQKQTKKMNKHLHFKTLDITYLDTVDKLESASYPADEKATRDKLKLRLEQASELFMGALDSETNELVGFICSTKTRDTILTHESMSKHDQDGRTVCIHSVVVDEKYRRQGIGSRMMKEYLKLPFIQSVDRLCLLSKNHLVQFYQDAGFELLGESDVCHGAEKWYDLRLILAPQ